MQGKRKTMEDVYEIQLDIVENTSFICLLDGHRGIEAAKFGSKYIPTVIVNKLKKEIDTIENIKNNIIKLDLNYCLNPLSNNSGTTYSFILVKFLNNKTYLIDAFWCGDTPIGLISLSNSKIIKISNEHKPNLINERKRIIKAGGSVQYDIFSKQWRCDGKLAMSRCFGNKQFKNNKQLLFNEQKIISEFDHKQIKCKEGDMIFMYTDGMSEPNLTNDEICKGLLYNLNNYTNASDAIGQTMNQILDLGSSDNQSGILIELIDGSNYVNNDSELFYPGPLYSYKLDKEFENAYFSNIKSQFNYNDKLMIKWLGYIEDIKELQRASGIVGHFLI